MDRRTFLRRAGPTLVATAAVSGCTTEHLQEAERTVPLLEGVHEEEIDLPVSQRLGIADAAIERASEAGVATLDEFDSLLADADLAVEHLEATETHGDPVLSLEYAVEEAPDRGLMGHLGTVAGGYASLVAASDERSDLEATVVDPTAGPFGEYEIRHHWAREFDDGELTARAYAKEITVTVAATA